MIFIEFLERRRLFAATTLRIDVGGNGFVEDTGKTWQADRGFTGGTVATNGTNVAGTTSDALFNTRRYGNFSYSLAIKSGDYRVRLLLMDPTDSTGQRQFDVFSEKKLVLNDFDIAAAGGTNAAVTKTFTTTVSDGRLNLWFQNVKDNAIVSAIEVTPIAASGIAWQSIANAPQAKFESMGDVVNNELYVFGGYDNAQIQATSQVAVYDPTSGAWSTRANMPVPLTHSGTANDGQYIYLAGGYVGDWKGLATPVTKEVWRYDTVNDSWTPMLSLPEARAAGALVRVGRKLHFFGGVDSSKDDSGDHWVLDLRHPTKWIKEAPMPDPRNHLGAIETGGEIYAIGGLHGQDEDTGNDDEVDAYNVVTATWSQVASLPEVLSHVHNATFAVDGMVDIVGGTTAGDTSVSDVLQYDPATDRWRKIGDLPVALSATVADLLNGHIIVTGGTTAGSVPVKTGWINA